MTTLFQVYDAALENARMNDIEFTRQYLQQYTDAMEGFVYDADIEKIVNIHKSFGHCDENEHYHNVYKPLSAVEIEQ